MVVSMITMLSSLSPEMNGSTTPVTRAPRWMGMTTLRMRVNQPAPVTCAASSGSGPSCIMALMPDREEYGRWVTASTMTSRVIEPYRAGTGPRCTANRVRNAAAKAMPGTM